MAENKTSIISPTLITAVVCVLASIAGAVGVDVTATEQADFKDLPSKGIYVAKGGFFVKNGTQIRSFDFKEVLLYVS